MKTGIGRQSQFCALTTINSQLVHGKMACALRDRTPWSCRASTCDYRQGNQCRGGTAVPARMGDAQAPKRGARNP